MPAAAHVLYGKTGLNSTYYQSIKRSTIDTLVPVDGTHPETGEEQFGVVAVTASGREILVREDFATRDERRAYIETDPENLLA